jgi:hypothetical protein
LGTLRLVWSHSIEAVQANDHSSRLPICRWLAVYGGLTGGVIIVALLRASLFFWASMVAATRMHNSMVVCVLRAPLAFFHTNPAGRVLNRFSNDQVQQPAAAALLFACVFCSCAQQSMVLGRLLLGADEHLAPECVCCHLAVQEAWFRAVRALGLIDSELFTS